MRMDLLIPWQNCIQQIHFIMDLPPAPPNYTLLRPDKKPFEKVLMENGGYMWLLCPFPTTLAKHWKVGCVSNSGPKNSGKLPTTIVDPISDTKKCLMILVLDFQFFQPRMEV